MKSIAGLSAAVSAALLVTALPTDPRIRPGASNGVFGADGDSVPKSGFGIVPVPFVSYAPETSLMLGAQIIGYHNHDPDDEDSLQDGVKVAAAYTLKNQFMSYLAGDLHTAGGKAKVSLTLAANSFPDTFFGIGNDTDESLQEDYLKREVILKAFCGILFAAG